MAVVAAGAAQAAPARAGTTWLCSPDLERAADPCRSSLQSTVVTAAGELRPEPRARPARRGVDCFYVYPTVSGRPGSNSNLAIDPEIRAVAIQQAARFTSSCRVFAPVYRQRTVWQLILNLPAVILGLDGVLPGESASVQETAYADVRSAWREFLARVNPRRGFVLIGHSQGSEMLTRLLREQIEPRPRARRRLVSAILVGGNVLLGKGGVPGGSLKRTPACARPRQTGCLVGYSAYPGRPPGGTVFGRSDDPRLEVLCTNPARLAGRRSSLRAYFPTEPFPGLFGVMADPAPPGPTPWVSHPGLYRARCIRDGDLSWLQVTTAPAAEDPRPRVGERLGPTAGYHLSEVNLALGNLVGLVRRQAAAYARRR